MDFCEYQGLAHETANHNKPHDVLMMTAGLGVAGESGEVADYLKKVYGHDHELDEDKLVKELGDVLWCVAQLATLMNLSLEDIAVKNIDKLRERYPEGFESEKSINRKDGDD